MPRSNSTDKSEFLPRHAAARLLGIGTTFLDKLIRCGTVPAFKVGSRTVLLRREDLLRVATASPVHAPPAQAPSVVRKRVQ